MLPSYSGEIPALVCVVMSMSILSCVSFCLFPFQYIRLRPGCRRKGGGLWILLIPFVHQTLIDCSGAVIYFNGSLRL